MRHYRTTCDITGRLINPQIHFRRQNFETKSIPLDLAGSPFASGHPSLPAIHPSRSSIHPGHPSIQVIHPSRSLGSWPRAPTSESKRTLRAGKALLHGTCVQQVPRGATRCHEVPGGATRCQEVPGADLTAPIQKKSLSNSCQLSGKGDSFCKISGAWKVPDARKVPDAWKVPDA